ncbi:hypothetical protein TNCV_1728181 [Trichonephila clavipes]|nr:hypothetical protein TNCV_1728181 [Trichonephila clavipes]
MPVLLAVNNRRPLRSSTAFRITILIPYSANSQWITTDHVLTRSASKSNYSSLTTKSQVTYENCQLRKICDICRFAKGSPECEQYIIQSRSRSGQEQHCQERKGGTREQQHISLTGSPSRRRQLQDVRLYGFIIHFSDRQSGKLLLHESHIRSLIFFI